MNKENNINLLAEKYTELTKRDKTEFRKAIQQACGWDSEMTFNRKRKGTTPIKSLELDAIKKIAKNF